MRGLRNRRTAFLTIALFICLLLTVLQGCRQNSGDVCEIVIENLTYGQEMPDIPLVEEAASRITLPAIGCRVKIKNVSIAEQQSALRLMTVKHEAIDLVNTGRVDALPDMVSDALLLPLDDLLARYGGALFEANRALLPACRIDGQTYAVPSMPYVNNAAGFIYNADMAEEYGIALSAHPDLAELEAAAAILAAHGKYLLLPSAGLDTSRVFSSLYADVHAVSPNLFCGVTLEGNSPTQLCNPYETEAFLDYCIRIRSWAERGWIPENYLLSGGGGNQSFLRGDVFMAWSIVSPIEHALQARDYPFRIGMFATAETALSTANVQECGWGISASSQHPEKAMQLLNLMYEDEALANLLMNGIEGREYQKRSEHIIALPADWSAQELDYSRQFTFFGDYRKIDEWAPMTEADYEALADFYEAPPQLDALFGYAFNVNRVSAQAAAVQAVLEDYLPALECGMLSDVPTAVGQLNEKLRQAGIDLIIAENQRQLDEWLRERDRQ